MPTRTKFLNVDLDLVSDSGIVVLLRALEPHVLILHETENEASVELITEQALSLDEILNRFVDVIEGLPSDARTVWDQCQVRRMNVGMQAGSQPHAVGFLIPLGTLRRLVSSSADIELTVYAPIPSSE